MSESLTINTLNQGHFTHTQAHIHRLGQHQVVGIREGEHQNKGGESPNSGPRGWRKWEELLSGACLQSRARVRDSFQQPQKGGADTQ